MNQGSASPNAKLTEEDVSNIRALVAHRAALIEEARTLTNEIIAGKFLVSSRTIRKIAAGDSWNHVM
jgi:hypothetical protein